MLILLKADAARNTKSATIRVGTIACTCIVRTALVIVSVFFSYQERCDISFIRYMMHTNMQWEGNGGWRGAAYVHDKEKRLARANHRFSSPLSSVHYILPVRNRPVPLIKCHKRGGRRERGGGFWLRLCSGDTGMSGYCKILYIPSVIVWHVRYPG